MDAIARQSPRSALSGMHCREKTQVFVRDEPVSSKILKMQEMQLCNRRGIAFRQQDHSVAIWDVFLAAMYCLDT